MVYKVDKKLIIFTFILFLASLFFTFSVYISEFGGGALAVCFVAVVFILFNLAVLVSKKIEITDKSISQTTIYGKKTVDINDIDDIGVVKLRWRVILILSDPHKFVFISSFYDDFEGFVQYLKDNLDEQIDAVESVTPKLIRKKQSFLLLMVSAMMVFFIGSGVYNILYR